MTNNIYKQNENNTYTTIDNLGCSIADDVRIRPCTDVFSDGKYSKHTPYYTIGYKRQMPQNCPYYNYVLGPPACEKDCPTISPRYYYWYNPDPVMKWG